jgi:hypothetical protein
MELAEKKNGYGLVMTFSEVAKALQIGRNKAYAIVKDAYETGAPFRVLMIDSQYRIVTATFFKWLKVLSRKFRKFDCRLVARS